MAKFQAKRIDTKLELTTLDGVEVIKEVEVPISGKQAAQLITEISKMDSEITEKYKAEPDKVMEIIDKQLSSVYNTEDGWWINNFDPQTLLEVKSYVLTTLTGVKKKEPN